MVGLQLTIHFGPSFMQWQGVGNNLLGIETGTNHAAEGNLSFLWVDAKNEIKTLEDGSVLMELIFKTIDNGLEYNNTKCGWKCNCYGGL